MDLRGKEGVMTTRQISRDSIRQTDVVHRICDAPDHVELAAAFYDALALAPTELRRAMRALARLEGGASAEAQHAMALARLRALLQLDDEPARIVSRAFDDAFLDLPAGWRGRNREIEFAAIVNGLDTRGFARLAGILPWLRERAAGSWLLERLPEEGAGPERSPGFAEPVLAATA